MSDTRERALTLATKREAFRRGGGRRVPGALFAWLPLSCLALALASCSTSPPPESTRVIPAIANLESSDLEGTWYEVGRISLPLIGDLVSTTDRFEANGDGSYTVYYEGRKSLPTGRAMAVKQKLKVPDASKKAEMSIRLIPSFWIKYRIIYMDPTKRFMIATSEIKDYLWILSRIPDPTADEYAKLVSRCIIFGFDVAKLIKVRQER